RERLAEYDRWPHAVTLSRELRRIENALADSPPAPSFLPDISCILEAFPFPAIRYSDRLTQANAAVRLEAKRSECIAAEWARMIAELRESAMAGHFAWHLPNLTEPAQRSCFARAFGVPGVREFRSFLFVPESMNVDDRDERWQFASTAAYISF